MRISINTKSTTDSYRKMIEEDGPVSKFQIRYVKLENRLIQDPI